MVRTEHVFNLGKGNSSNKRDLNIHGNNITETNSTKFNEFKNLFSCRCYQLLINRTGEWAMSYVKIRINMPLNDTAQSFSRGSIEEEVTG